MSVARLGAKKMRPRSVSGLRMQVDWRRRGFERYTIIARASLHIKTIHARGLGSNFDHPTAHMDAQVFLDMVHLESKLTMAQRQNPNQACQGHPCEFLCAPTNSPKSQG